MGIVKFFSPSGATPPPTYRNFVATISGSYANYGVVDPSILPVYIPLNNVSKTASSVPENDQNETSINFSSSGQDVDFYIYGVNIVLSNIGASGGDGNPYQMNLTLYINNEISPVQQEILTNFGVVELILPNPIAVTDRLLVTLTSNNCNYCNIVSVNTLFYCTGDITPPPACEYFERVSAGNGGSQLICISPIIGLAKQTPLIYQAVNWTGGLSGNKVPRIRFWEGLSSNPSATLIQGETYYVEVTFSTPLPVISGNQKNMGLYFGYNINSRINPFPVTVDGSLTTPQGFYLVWNPNSEVDPLFMFIGESMGSPNQYNGQITFRVGTSYCP